MNKLSDIFDIVYGNGYELINLKKLVKDRILLQEPLKITVL